MHALQLLCSFRGSDDLMSRPSLFRLDTYSDPLLLTLPDLNGVLYLTVRANGTD